MVRSSTQQEQVLEVVRQAGVLRARDLARHGLARTYLKPLVEQGLLIQAGRGLYVPADDGEEGGTEYQTLIEAQVRVPHAVICLASALRFHELTTQNPWKVWILIESGTRVPQVLSPSLLVFRAGGPSFHEGIETTHTLGGGAPLRITGVAKTVVDCFKYRNRIGLDVALEALKACLRERRATSEELHRYAKICRVERVMQPYMDAMVI